MSAAIGGAGALLSRPPIAATLKVAIEEGGTVGACNTADVLRAKANGFDYDSTTGRLSFFGDCRPLAGRKVAVSYRSWVDQTPPGDPGGFPPPCGPEESCFDPGAAPDGDPGDTGPGDSGPPDGGACVPIGDDCDSASRCCSGAICEGASLSDGGVSGTCQPIG